MVDAKLDRQLFFHTCGTEDDTAALEFSFEYPRSNPDRQPVPGSIGDTPIWVMDYTKNPEIVDPDCRVSWEVEPTTAVFEGYVPMVTVAAPDCAGARDHAETLIPALREPPTTDVTPQHPLLYAPDEPDSPRPGACAMAPIDHECVPYVEVPVPDNANSILAGSDNDPNVQCAVALDEVAAVFGTRFQPVIVGEPDFSQCLFVGPDRLLEIEFDIWSDPLGRETTYSDTTDRDFAGHPGRVRTGGADHWAKASTSATRDEGGTLNLSVRTGPLTSGPVTPENIAAVETLLTEILENHFS